MYNVKLDCHLISEHRNQAIEAILRSKYLLSFNKTIHFKQLVVEDVIERADHEIREINHLDKNDSVALFRYACLKQALHEAECR